MKLLDRERLMKAIYAFSGRSKKIRKDKRKKRKKEEDNIKKNKVKTGYSAGSFLMSYNGVYEALTGSTETQSHGVVEPPSLKEINEAINELKDNKGLGPGTIPSELLKMEEKRLLRTFTT
ncbi:hypothetical protein TNCV_2459131 [Trichonephila clavipes]|nr:hypothetical protein TNCV_2459131 [Trichonephila clavipes]